jgi:hypothetical protein
MSIIIEEAIGHLRQPFTIKEDGTSQTRLTNRGRVGFHVERLFGIMPNKDRGSDFKDCELKTLQPGNKVTIGTMPNEEFDRIKRESIHQFETSDPFKKMKKTLFVVYTNLSKIPEPTYYMNGWGLLDLTTLNEPTKRILQLDYEHICETIASKCNSRDDVTRYLRNYGSISGKYLSLAYKGAGDNGYNYPAWSFQSTFMKKLIHA